MTTSRIWECPSFLRDQLYRLYGLTCAPRWGLPRREHFPTLGPAVARVMAALGTPPMPWQRYQLDVAGEVNPATGTMAYGRVGLSVMRQMGKTALSFGVITHRSLAWPRQRTIYSAQNGQAAEGRWREEYLPLVESSPFAESMRGRKSRGSMGADWGNGSVSNLATSSESSGHGPPLDLGFIDELFSQKDNRLEQAMSPAMLTRGMSQLWWASAGGTELSVPLNEKRAAGRELVEDFWRAFKAAGWRALDVLWPTTLYTEWSAPTDAEGNLVVPRDDPGTWLANMPAVCPAPPCKCGRGEWRHTTTVDKIRGELEELRRTPEEFDRAFLNITRKSVPSADPNVPVAEWPTLIDVRSRRGPEVAFAADVTPRRDHAAIGVYSIRADGLGHVEVIDHRPGWEWVVGAFLRLRELWNPIAFGLDIKSDGGKTLAELLERAGIKVPADPESPKRGELYIPSALDVATACGDIAADVRGGGCRHIDQAPLNTAIEGTVSRPLGDAFAWARRNSVSDIAPWCAVTLARRTYHVRAPLILDRLDPVDNIW